MDYSLSEALKYTHNDGIPKSIVIYDIMCQYWPHMKERWSSKPDLYWPQGLEVQPAIGLLHVHGHQETCMGRFSASFVQDIGRTDGEVLESLWSPLNQVFRATQSASVPHRAEIIDDHMLDSNWKKQQGIGKCSFMSYREFSHVIS